MFEVFFQTQVRAKKQKPKNSEVVKWIKMGKDGKTMGNLWRPMENCGKLWGKLWKTYGKPMENLRKTNGKPWKPMEN